MNRQGDNPGSKWTPDRIVAAIADRARKHQSLASFSVRREDEPLWEAAKRHFGSWSRALEAAGIQPRRRRVETDRVPQGSWSRERIIQHIRRYQEEGHDLRPHTMQKCDNRLVSAAGYYFGSWSKALEAAGVNPDAVRASVPWTPERVKALIHDACQSGADLSDGSIRFWNRALYRAACTQFGSWDRAVTESLQDDPAHTRWSAERVRQLVEDYLSHGFSIREAFRYHRRLWREVVHHYGSLENLAVALKLPPESWDHREIQGAPSRWKTWRLRRNLSVEDLAQRLGIAPFLVEAYERGQGILPWTLYCRWAAIVGAQDETLRHHFPAHKSESSRTRVGKSRHLGSPALSFGSNGLCFVVDPEGVIRYWNPQLFSITGIASTGTEGRLCREVVRTYSPSSTEIYCGGSQCPVRTQGLGDRAPCLRWTRPEGRTIRLHMLTDTAGWIMHWLEPLSAQPESL